MKKVLITGANSYIGNSFEKWAREKYFNQILTETIDMKTDTWKTKDFSIYDCVFHVAGIAHADVSSVSDDEKALYYKVNRDLAIETAIKAKNEGIKQFIFMSSSIIYGESSPFGVPKIINAETKPSPANCYGDSKWQAEQGIRKLANNKFAVTILRPPMIYGKNCRGNYPFLSTIAKSIPVFPNVYNERSMLFIDNFCEFLCKVIIHAKDGVFWPQNAEYTKTCEMVKMIAEVSGHRILVSKYFNWIVFLASCIPGSISKITNKAFGNMCYDQSLSQYDFEYRIVDLGTSIERIER